MGHASSVLPSSRHPWKGPATGTTFFLVQTIGSPNGEVPLGLAPSDSLGLFLGLFLGFV